MNYNIYYFYVDGRRYKIIYKNRPFLYVKHCLKSKRDFMVLKYRKLLFGTKKLKSKLFFMAKKMRKYLHYKYLSLKYEDIDVDALNLLGDLDFSCTKGDVAVETILYQLSVEFRTLEAEIEV